MSKSFMARYGDQLVAGGFPILPIVPGEKFPGKCQQKKWFPYKGWMKHASRATTTHELAIWKQWPDAGIGVAGGCVAGVDIDIVDDQELSESLQKLAFEVLGTTPAVRIGRSPKRLLVYRTKEPFKGIKAHPLEILCHGQQFVAYAIHPDTQRPYEWPDTSLADLTIEQLPEITEEQARNFLDKGFQLIPEELRPASLSKIKNAPLESPSSTRPIVVSGGLRGTQEAIQDAMRYIVNADLDYDSWISIGMALKGALGEDGTALFIEWSASSSKNDPEVTANAWASFRPTVIGAGTVYHHAQKNGWSPDPAIVMNPGNQHAGPHPAAEMLQKMQHLPPVSISTSEPESSTILEGPAWDPSDIDGVLGMLVAHILKTAPRPQPILSVGNALCALGALMGRRYRTETNLRSNIYVVGIADSGSGKNHSREVITDLFVQNDMENFLGGNRIASGAGLLRAVKDNPAILFQQDEFGMFLQAAADRRRSPKYITDILDLMTEMYSSAGTTFLGPEYAVPDKDGRKDIKQPCLCIYGTTTPVMFWSSLKSANVADGSLARFMILKTREDYPERNAGNVICQTPPELIAALHSVRDNGSLGGGNIAGLTKDRTTALNPMVVPLSNEAKEQFDTFSEQVVTKLRKIKSTIFSSIIARAWENAMKVALIRAVSANPPNPVIRKEDAEWAIGLVVFSINTLVKDVERHVADNQTEEYHKRLLEIVRKAGKKGISKTALGVKSRFLTRRARNEILSELVDEEIIHTSTLNSSGSKPVTVFCLTVKKHKE